jgi:hypothetical protein
MFTGNKWYFLAEQLNAFRHERFSRHGKLQIQHTLPCLLKTSTVSNVRVTGYYVSNHKVCDSTWHSSTLTSLYACAGHVFGLRDKPRAGLLLVMRIVLM